MLRFVSKNTQTSSSHWPIILYLQPSRIVAILKDLLMLIFGRIYAWLPYWLPFSILWLDDWRAGNHYFSLSKGSVNRPDKELHIVRGSVCVFFVSCPPPHIDTDARDVTIELPIAWILSIDIGHWCILLADKLSAEDRLLNNLSVSLMVQVYWQVGHSVLYTMIHYDMPVH